MMMVDLMLVFVIVIVIEIGTVIENAIVAVAEIEMVVAVGAKKAMEYGANH